MDKRKVRIFDSAFTPFVKSASLREENKDVGPTHFEWESDEGAESAWFTDGNLRWITEDEIAWLIEPRHLRPENYAFVDDPLRRVYMKHILTYDKELLDKYPDKALFYPLGGSSIALDRWGVYPKTKDICMILSDKKTTEGHKLRHQIAEEFGDRIDLYGAGVGKPFDSKFEILKDYRYCVVVESGLQPLYFSEKLIDAISVGCIPLYCGADFIEDFFDTKGMRQFNGIKYFRDIIIPSHENTRRYERFLETNLENAKNYRICEDYIYENYPGLFE